MASKKELMSGLTAEWLRANLIYDRHTGDFRWRVAGPGRSLNRRSLGTVLWNGYKSMKLCGTVYYAHRIAWFYVHGEWPPSAIDHIDGNPGNNSIGNLRLATSSQNSASKRSSRNIAPSRGVMPHGPGFVVRIHSGGKRHYLGYRATAAEAKALYEAKAKEIHGEFAHVEPSWAPMTQHAGAASGALGFGA